MTENAIHAPAMQIVIKPPPKNSPGFMRRKFELLKITERLNKEQSAEAFEALIRFHLRVNEVIVPDGVDAFEAFLDLSEEQFEEIAKAIRGDVDTVPPPNGA